MEPRDRMSTDQSTALGGGGGYIVSCQELARTRPWIYSAYSWFTAYMRKTRAAPGGPCRFAKTHAERKLCALLEPENPGQQARKERGCHQSNKNARSLTVFSFELPFSR